MTGDYVRWTERLSNVRKSFQRKIGLRKNTTHEADSACILNIRSSIVTLAIEIPVSNKYGQLLEEAKR